MVHLVRFVEPDGGPCGLAQHKIQLGLSRGYVRCRDVAPRNAGVASWCQRPQTPYGGGYRFCRLAVSSRVGATTPHVGVLRGGVDGVDFELCAAAIRAAYSV